MSLKNTENFFVLGLFLAVLGLISAVLLAVFSDIVSEPIAAAELRTTNEALRQILPAFDNQPSENMRYIVPFVNKLKKDLPDVPVEMYDERFTSVLAHKAMLDGGMKKMARRDKAIVDEISATIILNDYLQSIQSKL